MRMPITINLAKFIQCFLTILLLNYHMTYKYQIIVLHIKSVFIHFSFVIFNLINKYKYIFSANERLIFTGLVVETLLGESSVVWDRILLLNTIFYMKRI